MAGNKRIVGPSPTGKGWQNVDPNGATTHHRTQKNAEKRAGDDLRKSGGGERTTAGEGWANPGEGHDRTGQGSSLDQGLSSWLGAGWRCVREGRHTRSVVSC